MSDVFDGFFEVVAKLLAALYSLTDSYGGAIILLTIIVMILTAPLTLKSTKSMLQMQRLQPELRKLQAKYKDDREKLNTEMMAFYKENEINPLSGCVPVLMQAPIFIILYQVLRGLTQRAGGHASGLGHVVGQLRAEVESTPWRVTDSVFQPQHLDGAKTSELYKSLTVSNHMNFFGVDLSISPSQAFQIGIVTSIPFLLLMVGMLVSQIIQNRQIQGRNKDTGQVNPQQQAIMKVLPFMLPVFSFGFPAGLGLYYFVQGLCRIGLQHYITKKVYEPHHAEVAEAKSKRQDDDDPPAKPKAAKSTAKGAKSPGKGDDVAPKSAKAAAVQKKQSQKQAPAAGRKSGAPRAGGQRRSGS